MTYHAQHGEDFSRLEKSTCQMELPINSRIHYLDNLRAIAMLLGLVFHAALAYSPMLESIWLTADPNNSQLFDIFAWFSHIFRMPLFFVIAGFFALSQIRKRGIDGMLKNRGKRIFIPFLIFLPLVLVGYLLSIGWAMENVTQLSPMMQLIVGMQNQPESSPAPMTTSHLWFLLYLCWFYLLLALFSRWPLLNSKWTNRLIEPNAIILWLPVLLIPVMLFQPVPHPAPESFFPQLWAIGYYGAFFMLGTALFQNVEALDRLWRWRWHLLISALVGYVVFYQFLAKEQDLLTYLAMQTQGAPLTLTQLMLVSLQCFIAVYMTMVCLLWARIWLNRANSWVRYIADSSYWIYIVHLPVLFAVQFYLTDSTLNLGWKFLIAVFTTFSIGLVSYTLLVRWTPIGWLLNGKPVRTEQKDVHLISTKSSVNSNSVI